jgi:hypothetical protein
MTNNDNIDLRTQAPEWLTAADIDQVKISAAMAEVLKEGDPELFAEAGRGELVGWFDAFDGEGWTTLRIHRRATGEDTGAGAQVHWSAIVRGDVESS